MRVAIDFAYGWLPIFLEQMEVEEVAATAIDVVWAWDMHYVKYLSCVFWWMRWHLTPVVMVLKYRVTLSFVSRLSIESLSLERVSNYLGSQVNTMFELNQCGPCYSTRERERKSRYDTWRWRERGAEVVSIKMQASGRRGSWDRCLEFGIPTCAGSFSVLNICATWTLQSLHGKMVTMWYSGISIRFNK